MTDWSSIYNLCVRGIQSETYIIEIDYNFISIREFSFYMSESSVSELYCSVSWVIMGDFMRVFMLGCGKTIGLY